MRRKEGGRKEGECESSGPHYSRVATQVSMQAWSSLGLRRPTSGMCVRLFVCRHLHVCIIHTGHAHTCIYVRTHVYNVCDACNILFAELLSVT